MFGVNEQRFVGLLEKLIGESKFLQNHPPQFVPEEDRALQHVLAVLDPFRIENGGVLTIKHIHYKPKRGNLIIEYRPPTATKIVSFVGSHLDVVPANPESWDVDPFSLTRKGDQLFGRGTTDCLGHVALLTDFMCTLAEKKPQLSTAVVVVFIASEENTMIPEVGIEQLMANGYLDPLKPGPVFWVDSADNQPCIGTAGVFVWSLKATGKLFHSGLPHKGINAIELARDAVAEIQRKFYLDFPPLPIETEYNFSSSSSLKPTQVRCAEGGLNQLPPWCEIQGDVRLTPFYKLKDCIAKVKSYVDDVNAHIEQLGSEEERGKVSKYVITEADGSTLRGKVELKVLEDPMQGIACQLDSPGYKALCAATKEVLGEVVPFSDCGSLPLVGEMQEAGYDLQVIGFGCSSVYHGDNEYCRLSDMNAGAKIMSRIIDLLQQ